MAVRRPGGPGGVTGPARHDDKMGLMPLVQAGRSTNDVVEFRRQGGASNERAKVLVNATELVKLWHSATNRDAAPLWTSALGPSLEWWGPDGKHPEGDLADWVPAGFAPVLTCTCGEFGCGGALVRVSFERRFVVWSDFRTANYEQPIRLGPFRFALRAYEAARQAFERQAT